MKAREMERLADFLGKSGGLRREFAEHAREIDRAVYQVIRKVHGCGEPKCDCNMSFEQFHAQQTAIVERLRSQIENYEFS